MESSTKEIIFKEVNPVHFVTQLGASSEHRQSCLAQHSFNQMINIFFASQLSSYLFRSSKSQLDKLWWIINMRNKWEIFF